MTGMITERMCKVADFCDELDEGVVLLTVNQRLARHRSRQFQQWQQGQKRSWWETPEILPVRSWLLSLHKEYLMSGVSELTLLPALLQQRAWEGCVLADEGPPLLDQEAASRGAKRAWEIACAWKCHPNDDDYLPLDQFTWRRWRAVYLNFLDEQGCIDDASLADHIGELLEGGKGVEALPKKIILDGFLELPPQLESLVSVIRNTGTEVHMSTIVADAKIHHVSYEDDSRELLGIATQMRKELERDGSQSLGLIVSDLQNRRAEVLRAFDQVFFPAKSPKEIQDAIRPYDLSLGLPLADTTVVKSALLILKLCSSEIQGSDISALLLSPYLASGAKEPRVRERLDRELRDQRVRKLSLGQLATQENLAGRLVKPVNKLLKSRKLGNATLSVWASRFSEWLTILGWPGAGMDTEEYQAVTAWIECLDDMQLLDNNEGVSLYEAINLLSRLAYERIFQLESPMTPIQIMGRLESHGISFDCLWVAGLDSEQWPPPGSPTPFLPIAQQKLAGVPDASAPARLLLAEREFLQWSSQAPLLLASRALRRDGKELEAAHLPAVKTSAENQALAEQRLAQLQTYEIADSPMQQLCAKLQLEQLVDHYGPAMAAGSKARGGSRLFENQALCPFKAFALHRLAIRPLEEAGLGLDPRQHGTLLHSALELFWQNTKTQEALIAMNEEELDAAILTAIDEAILITQVPESLRALERRRLQNLLHEWCTELESRRPGFEIQSLEQRQEIEHGGIGMTVVIDRIDKVDDSLIVVDYKTGVSNSVNTWADKRISNPQLPLYVLTNDEISGVSFAQVSKNQCKFKGVSGEPNMLPGVKTTVTKSRNGQATERELVTWADWRMHWKEALDVVAAEVRQGLATVSPMKSACTYCELKSMCRIDEEQFVDDGDFDADGASSATMVSASASGQLNGSGETR